MSEHVASQRIMRKFNSTGLILLFMYATLGDAFAQNTVFTYQGRVTANGTNFSGVGRFKFALLTSTNANHTATATANAPSGGFITGYTVTSGGNGYAIAPVVTISASSAPTAPTILPPGPSTGKTMPSAKRKTPGPKPTYDPLRQL